MSINQLYDPETQKALGVGSSALGAGLGGPITGITGTAPIVVAEAPSGTYTATFAPLAGKVQWSSGATGASDLNKLFTLPNASVPQNTPVYAQLSAATINDYRFAVASAVINASSKLSLQLTPPLSGSPTITDPTSLAFNYYVPNVSAT